MSLSTKILPIWHGVNSEDVIRFSPMLATIVALPSSSGVDMIASEIYKVITGTQSKSDHRKVEEQYDSLFQNVDVSQIRDIQDKRFRFLLKLYQNRDRTRIKNNMFDLGQELGYPNEITKEIMQYYKEKGYLEHTASGGGVEITVDGIDFIEEQLPDSQEVKEVKSNRDSVLRELYKERESKREVDMRELAKRLRIPNDSAIFDIAYYLEKKRLISTRFSNAKIATDGIDYVERMR